MVQQFQRMDSPQETLENHTIPQTTDESTLQDHSVYGHELGQPGVFVAVFSPQQFVENAADDLPVGTYTLPFKIPDNAIVSGAVLVDVTEAPNGAGTIDIELDIATGAPVALTQLTNATAIAPIDESANVPAGTKIDTDPADPDQDSEIRVIVGGAAINEGTFVLYIPYFVGAA